MRNIFGVNITEDKTNTAFDGHIFHSKSGSSKLAADFEATSEFIEKIESKSKLPLSLRIIKTLSGIIAGIIAVGIIRGLGSVSLAEGYQNAPVLHYVLVISFFVWLLLFIWSKMKMKNVKDDDDYEEAKRLVASDVKSLEEEFGIPSDAKDMDVLIYKYRIKNGKEKLVSSGFSTYINLGCIVFVKEDYLYLVSMREEWAIPLRSMIKVERVNKKASIPISNWNKETLFNKGEFKQYKMTYSGTHIFFKPYYDFIINYEGNNYKLSIPPYELDVLLSLTGLALEE